MTEVRENLIEAVQLVLEANRKLAAKTIINRDVIREKIEINEILAKKICWDLEIPPA